MYSLIFSPQPEIKLQHRLTAKWCKIGFIKGVMDYSSVFRLLLHLCRTVQNRNRFAKEQTPDLVSLCWIASSFHLPHFHSYTLAQCQSCGKHIWKTSSCLKQNDCHHQIRSAMEFSKQDIEVFRDWRSLFQCHIILVLKNFF